LKLFRNAEFLAADNLTTHFSFNRIRFPLPLVDLNNDSVQIKPA